MTFDTAVHQWKAAESATVRSRWMMLDIASPLVIVGSYCCPPPWSTPVKQQISVAHVGLPNHRPTAATPASHSSGG
jgi:hypothetical protein